MPAYLTETLYRFCTPEGYSRFTQNKRAYTWVHNHWADLPNPDDETEQITRNAFRAVLMFMKVSGKSPNSLEALRDWIRTNPSNDIKFEKSSVEKELKELINDYEPLDIDDEVLFQALMNAARLRWVESTASQGSGIADGSRKVKLSGSNEEASGPAVAIQWMRSRFAEDFNPEAPSLAGRLDENVLAIKAEMYSRLMPQDGNGRFPLGLPHIDKNVIVGKQNLRFIGIVGMSGDGKTTLTNQICYNWLKQGASILYVSMEHTPLELWQAMAFLHSSHPDYDFTLPQLSDWDNGIETRLVTPQDERNLNLILKDIEDRRNIPGLLDCQQFRDWDATKDYLLTNHPKNKYDILIIDYIGRFTVPGDQKFRDKAIGALVHEVQGLTQSFDENKGLICLTPIQVNREGNKRANAAAEDAASRYDLNAISTISEYQHDLDLCLSVWSDADMKYESKVLIEQIKQRKGKRTPREIMFINPNTGGFDYAAAESTTTPVNEAKNNWNRTAEEVLSSTTTVDGEWAL